MDALVGVGIGVAGAMIGTGLVVWGAAKGIGNIGGNAVEAIARQPEAKGSIGTNMIIAAALIEGVALISLLVIGTSAVGKLPAPADLLKAPAHAEVAK